MQKIKQLFLSLPVQLFLCLIIGALGSVFFPLSVIKSIYTASCLLKDLLMLFLPILISAYLWAAIVSFGNKGLFFIAVTFLLMLIANLVTLYSIYGLCTFALPSIIDSALPQFTNTVTTDSVTPLFRLSFLENFIILQPKQGMFLGIFCGIVTVFFYSSYARLFTASHAKIAQFLSQTALSLRTKATLVLRKGFIPLLPIYVIGFVLKLACDADLGNLLHGYAHTFAFIVVILVSYLCLWYWIGNKFNFSKTLTSLKNMIPAGITGFTTLSSSATMPITLEATEKNLNDREFADFFIPTTVNAHLTGDNISITITALALLILTGQGMPSFYTFSVFAIHYGLIKFSSAGVPGGGVIVILPVVKEYLGLDDATTMLLQTIYILQDPLLTASNVMGNGAFALVAHKIMGPFIKKKKEEGGLNAKRSKKRTAAT